MTGQKKFTARVKKNLPPHRAQRPAVDVAGRMPDAIVKPSRLAAVDGDDSSKIAVIGVGRLGGSLARALVHAGFSLIALVDSDRRAAQNTAAACGRGTRVVSLAALPEGLTHIFICVPDDSIAGTARALAVESRIEPTAIVAHCSGALSVAALGSLKGKTQRLASMHPAQTFSGAEDDWRRFEDIYFALEGDAAAVSNLQHLVGKLGSRCITLTADEKTLYHIGCVFMSNYIIALQSAAADCLRKIGLREDEALALFRPLLKTTCEHVDFSGLQAALTGPIARGDVDTVDRHLQTLSRQQQQQTLRLYVRLGLQLVRLLAEHSPGGLSENQQKIAELLSSQQDGK